MLFSRSLSYVSGLARSQSGNVAVITSLALLPVAICAGAATDYVKADHLKTTLQGAIDAAALAAAASPSDSVSARKAMVLDFLSAKTDLPIVTPAIAADTETVTVSVATRADTSFLSLGGITSLPVHVTATAIAVFKPICLLSLNQTQSKSIKLWGSGASITANDCVVQSNSSSATAMANDSSATATADGFCAVGNAPSSGFVPAPKANCRKAKDPYAALPVPDVGTCDYHNKNITSGSVTIGPGIYCGGLSIGQATVHFEPGLYVMKFGDFKITGSNAVITGSDLTIYLYGGNSAVTISGGSEITLVSPTAGPYAGLLFVQHPDAGAGTSSTIMGNSNVKLVGTGYFPTQKLKVGGSGNFGILSPYMTFVADTMEFFGNGKITLNYDAAAAGYSNLAPKAFWGTRLTN